MDLPTEVLLAHGLNYCTLMRICRDLRDRVLRHVHKITMKTATAHGISFLNRHFSQHRPRPGQPGQALELCVHGSQAAANAASCIAAAVEAEEDDMA